MNATPEVNVDKLRACGWDFYMSGPNEWQWMKFARWGVCVAVQGDDAWRADVERCTERRGP